MRLSDSALAVAGLAAAALILQPAPVDGYVLTGDVLELTQRDFRVFNNFTDPEANDNQVPDPDYPGATGAVLAIWKGVAEWGSRPHGTGLTDPTQPVLGSGGANFDAMFQGLASAPGGPNRNIVSQIDGFGGATLAFTEIPSSNGWRIRFWEDPKVWEDGPGLIDGSNPSSFDIQGVMAHEYGHALGLNHSGVLGATMATNLSAFGIPMRSIEADDMAGVQAIYGIASTSKPRIDTYTLGPAGITLIGAHFDATDNEVWFTDNSGSLIGSPVRIAHLPASMGGTRLDVTLPPLAGEGDILVHVPGTAHSTLSNAFPFDPDAEPCVAPSSYGTSQPTSSGSVPVVSAVGLPSTMMGGFQIRVVSGPSTGTGVLFSGDQMANVPFGGGTLLVGGQLVRESVLQFQFGIAEATLDANPAAIGTTRFFQVWYADAGLPGGAGLTHGLTIQYCE